ncbi:CatB-related O-acetyltransferase [Anaeromyxobacter oryzisoli]|uniref:CatB-related O-acetyltransferase n=1 Tax=Anaeromyxobacter oryzisoli TaxID=2925408 RepID=UPI001F57D0F6|nr:CatB-related O-acetyltransferase [Anaeromyxobacter sp. SG63]
MGLPQIGKRLVKWAKFSVLGRGRGIRIGRNCQIGFRSELEGRNTILEGTAFNGRLGYATYLGRNCQIDGSIGRFCSISSEVVTIPGRHPTSRFVSTHPAFYSLLRQSGFTYARAQLFEERRFADAAERFGVVVGSDVLISFGVKLLEGVTVGHGAVLGAGALVTSDVEPYAIYAGVPARKIGQRFDREIVRRLLESRWWDRGPEWIEGHAPLFTDVERFLAACEAEVPVAKTGGS